MNVMMMMIMTILNKNKKIMKDLAMILRRRRGKNKKLNKKDHLLNQKYFKIIFQILEHVLLLEGQINEGQRLINMMIPSIRLVTNKISMIKNISINQIKSNESSSY